MNADGQINYQGFTDVELLEARQLINARAFPVNSRNLRNEIASRNLLARPSASANTPHGSLLPAQPEKVSMETVLLAAIFCFIILVIGGFDLLINGKFSLPNRVAHDSVIGVTATIFYAFVFIVFVMNCIKLYSLLNFPSNDNKLFRFVASVTNYALFSLIAFCVVSWLLGRA